MDPDTSPDRPEASTVVFTMIANPIRADSNCFWHGPDA
jgi:hypothetical protein